MSDLNSLIVKQLKRQKPKEGADSGTFEASLSTDKILSRIKYVLKIGLDPFDEAIGCLPFGRIVEIFGMEASGKSATCIKSLVMAQLGQVYARSVDRQTGEISLTKMEKDTFDVATVFVDNEQSIDEDQKVIIDGTELQCVIARCDTVDQLFKIVDITADKMKERQDQEDAKAKASKTDPVVVLTVIVVDTIAGTSSKEEMTQEWNKEDFQRQPKMLRKGFRRMARKINRNNILLICTNQVSEKFNKEKSFGNVPQARDYATFGGKALSYYASIRVFMYGMGDYKYGGAKFPQGLSIGFSTPKNRVVKPLRSARLVLLFNGGFSNIFSKLETMIFMGIVTYSKSTKRFTLRFASNGIETTTFLTDKTTKSLQDDDDRGRRSDDPELESKALWPTFYEAHKVDIDELWKVSKKIMFSDGAAADLTADDLDDDDDLDLDVDEI
jgi:RecA/RadA recombinase